MAQQKGGPAVERSTEPPARGAQVATEGTGTPTAADRPDPYSSGGNFAHGSGRNISTAQARNLGGEDYRPKSAAQRIFTDDTDAPASPLSDGGTDRGK